VTLIYTGCISCCQCLLVECGWLREASNTSRKRHLNSSAGVDTTQHAAYRSHGTRDIATAGARPTNGAPCTIHPIPGFSLLDFQRLRRTRHVTPLDFNQSSSAHHSPCSLYTLHTRIANELRKVTYNCTLPIHDQLNLN